MSADNWTREDIRIATESGHRVVTGWTHPSAPGIAVTETVGGLSLDAPYTITHLGSGNRCGARCYSLDEAKGLALELAPLGDWTRDGKALVADTALKSAVQDLYRTRKRRSRPPLPTGGDR